MVSVFTRPMCDIDTNEDVRTWEEKSTRSEMETQWKKKPQTHCRVIN